jgi:diguanylate cyclase (GGDEF)-like protein/PAS domain S-box-containing protein
LSGGVIEAHFHFFVMLAVIALYHNWVPFLVAIGYVLVHHGLVGVIAPDSVYNHADAIAHPWKWAMIHAAFVSGACLVYIVAWRLNEDAQRAVEVSEARFRRLAEHSPMGIYQLDFDGGQLYFNPVALDMLEVDGAEDVAAVGLDHFFGGSSLETVRAERQKREMGVASNYEVELVGMRGAKRTVLMSGSPMLDQNRRLTGIVGTVVDISDRKRLEEALRHQAFHDPLTRLANRARLTDRLQHALDRGRRSPSFVAVLFLDLDDFKLVNDRFGHSVGDFILLEVARRLAQAVRPQDTAACFGGDEFAVLLEDLKDIEEASEIAGRIQSALASPFLWNQKELDVRASIGIAASETRRGDTDALLREAEWRCMQPRAPGKDGTPSTKRRCTRP